MYRPKNQVGIRNVKVHPILPMILDDDVPPPKNQVGIRNVKVHPILPSILKTTSRLQKSGGNSQRNCSPNFAIDSWRRRPASKKSGKTWNFIF